MVGFGFIVVDCKGVVCSEGIGGNFGGRQFVIPIPKVGMLQLNVAFIMHPPEVRRAEALPR